MRPGVGRSLGLWLPVAAVAAGIFTVSQMPNPPSPGPEFFLKDKVGHICVYAVLGLALARAFAGSGFSTPRAAAAAVVAAALYGLSDEFHQTFVPGRAFELTDLLADSAGAALGQVLRWGALGAWPRTRKGAG